MIRKTLLSALGAGTLLLGALAAGRTRRDAAPSGLHAKRVCAASTAGHGRELSVEGAGQRQGRGAEHRHPEPRRQDARPSSRTPTS